MQGAFLLIMGVIIGVIISLLIFKSLFKKGEMEEKLKKEIEAEMKIHFKKNLDLELSKAFKNQMLQKEKIEEEMQFKLTKSLENEISKALKIQLNDKVNIEELKQNVKSLEESVKEFKSKEIQLNSMDKKINEKENEKEIKEHKVMNFTTYKSNVNSKENITAKSDNSDWIKNKIINSKIEHLVMLVVRKGTNFGSKIQLQKNINTTIGRADNNMVVISENEVSTSHAVIKSDENGHFIQDLKSLTGTYVNERLIEEPILLQNGDIIRIGDTEFIFCKII